MKEHDTHYEIHCGICHVISQASLPLLVCPACLSSKVVAVLDVRERTRTLAALVPGVRVASEPLDTSEAYRPSSPHWGSHPGPTARVVD